MGAERFIEKLAERDALPESIIKRLRDKVASSSSVPSARALAQFLVDKGHLSRDDADEVLAASAPPKRARKPKKPKPEGAAADPKKRKSKRSSSSDPFAAGGDDGGAKGGKKKKKKRKGKKGDNEFDTPLILLGGGGLILLVLGVGGLLFLLFSENGEERLKVARSAFESGSYSQAIQEYETFLEDFSGHEGESRAKVTLAIARIRRDAARGEVKALESIKQEIPRVEDEIEFPAAQEDLAGILPKVARGLSDQADAAESLADIKQYIGLTEEALTLCENTKYVPSRLRDKQELTQIKAVLARIGLRQKALEDLASTIERMDSAVSQGDTKTAYQEHANFVKAHPEKAEDEGLLEAVAAASQAEQAGIRFVEDRAAALTEEAKSSVKAAVATADRRRTGEAPTDGLCVIQFQGSAYAFNRRDGRLLWRRPLGVSLTTADPVMVGGDCLLLDASQQELVRVNASTGRLVWRAPLGDDVTQPTLVGKRVLAAGQSGRLHVFDADTGARQGYVEFAQPLPSAPVVSVDGLRIYLAGDHSSLYSLNAEDLSCLGVYYLGHAKGTVEARPAAVLNRVVVVENDGAATSKLHLFAVDEQGVIAEELSPEEAAQTRLTGLVTRPPEVFGKRFAVMTDSGHIGVYEASADNEGLPITLLATRAAMRQPRSTRYSAVANKELWVAGTRLDRYSIQPSGKRLPGLDVEEPFRGDTFVHPLRVDGGVMIHVRRRRGRAGATVAATDTSSGEVFWETDIAAPAAGPPVSLNSNRGMLYATTSGRVFLVDDEAFASGVAERVVARAESTGEPMLNAGAANGDGAVYASLTSGMALGVNGAGEGGPVESFELPGALACPPQGFASGWLAPLNIGQVVYFSGDNGAALAAPFQPELAPRAALDWREPAVTERDGKSLAIVTDGRTKLYTLQLADRPAPNLSPIAEFALEDDRFTSRVAVAGGRAAVAAGGRLMLFDPLTLEATGATPLAAAAVWGPYAAGDRVVLATADNRLLAIDPSAPDSPAWTDEVPASELAGAPLGDANELLIPLRRGVLQGRSPQTGEITRTIEVRQALAGGSASRGAQLLLAAYDGALLLIEPTQAR